MTTTNFNFDKRNVDMLAREAMEALKAVAERHGLVLKPASGTYGEGHFKFAAQFAAMNDDGIVLTRAAVAFKDLAHCFGLEATDLGKTFRSGGHEYKIIGLRTAASKRPIMVERTDGKSFVFPADSVARLLKRPAAVAA